ncbi:MAG: hypothetical protein ACP5I1_06690 [Candidatus Hinthialibacter sp.]
MKSVVWHIQDVDLAQDERRLQPPRIWKKEFYDKKGSLLRQENYDSMGALSIEKTISSNLKGKIAVSKYANKDCFYQQYDRFGKVMEEYCLDENDKLKKRWTYKWDKKNRKNHASIFGEDGTLEGQAEWYYDNRFLVIRKKDIPNTEMEVVFDYDYNGRLSRREQIQYKQNDRWITSYKEGREIKREVFTLENKLTHLRTYQYEFDDHGNWTLQKKMDCSLPDQEPFEIVSQVITREISYY